MAQIKIIKAIVLLAWLLSASIVADEVSADKQQVVYRQLGELTLFGDYYPGRKKAGGVLLIHDCNTTRQNYAPLISPLVAKGLHVLAVDLRGFGQSIGDEASFRALRSEAKSLVNFQHKVGQLKAEWGEDVLAAYHFLRAKVDRQMQVATVSSGCATSFATGLASKMHIDSMVLLTPTMNFSEKESYKNLMDIRSYFIGSEHHMDSYATLKELFDWNGSRETKMQIFKGNRQGLNLIMRNQGLTHDIAEWLSHNLQAPAQ